MNSLTTLIDELKLLSNVTEQNFTHVVLSDDDYSAVCNGTSGSVITDAKVTVSPLSAFLQCVDLAGQHLLLHPACADLFACLQHFNAHRQNSSSAVVVLPKQPGMWRKFVRGAQLLQEHSCCDALFEPADDGSLGKHAAEVFYLAPVAVRSLCASLGSLGVTMQFAGSVSGAPASCLLDSGCTNTLMSAAYARRMNIAVEQGGGASLQVALPNGVVCSSSGACKVRLKLQQFSAELTCHVIELAEPYEVILGEDWLRKYSATLSWRHKCCVLTKGSQRISLVPDALNDTSAHVQSGSQPAAVITAIQAKRAVSRGCQAFVAVCTDAKSAEDETCAAAHTNVDQSSSAGRTDLTPDSVLEGLLHEYDDRFMSSLPPGLPPESLGASEHCRMAHWYHATFEQNLMV